MAEFSVKTTWLKAIEAGFYDMWPMLTMKAIAKYFFKLAEIQKVSQDNQGRVLVQHRRKTSK